MEKDKILELIMSYKRSSAFIAAYETGIFEMLHENALNIQELSCETGMNLNHLSLFLLFLNSMNLVIQEDGNWKLEDDLEASFTQLQAFDGIIDHERNIFERWMYPKRLEQSLMVKMGEREFDCIGFSEEEQKLYDQTMYGNNLRILGLRIMREIRGLKEPKILEYGRSKGSVLQALKNAGFHFEGISIQDEPLLGMNSSSQEPTIRMLDKNQEKTFDVIILYNTIHYLSNEAFQERLERLEKLLSENGRILIVDLFYSKKNAFSANILIDWLTHGGTNFLTTDSIEEELVKKHFHTIRLTEVKDINGVILAIERLHVQ